MGIKDFTWDDSPETQKQHDDYEFDFSETGGELDTVKKEEKEEEEEEGVEKVEGKKTEAETKHVFDFGNEGEDDEEDEEDEDEEEEDNKSTKSKATSKDSKQTAQLNSKGVLTFLKSKGLADFDEDLKIEDLSDDEAEDQLEDYIESSNEKYMAEQVAALPEIAKNIIKLANKGGDVNSYLATLAQSASTGITKDLDLSKETNQEKVMRVMLASEGKDAEEIQDEIDFLKEKDKLESSAAKRFEKWKKKQDNLETEAVEKQAKAVALEKENNRKYRTSLTEVLSKSKEINSFNITPIDKKELPTYIANPAYETPTGKVISEFQKDLFEAMKDDKKVIALAKILKSNFDFSKIAQKGASAASKEIKDIIQNKKEASDSRTKRTPKRLIDLLD